MRREPRRRLLVGRAVDAARRARTAAPRRSPASCPATPTPRAAPRSPSRVITPGLTCGSRPVSRSTSAHMAREIVDRGVVAEPLERPRAAAYRSSGLSPSVNSASWQPAACAARGRSPAPRRATDTAAATAARRLREGAVVADVAAQPRQRDEHLARIGDDVAVALVAQIGGRSHQHGERCRQKPIPLLAGIRSHTWSIYLRTRPWLSPARGAAAGRPSAPCACRERRPAFRLRASYRLVQPFLCKAGWRCLQDQPFMVTASSPHC